MIVSALQRKIDLYLAHRNLLLPLTGGPIEVAGLEAAAGDWIEQVEARMPKIGMVTGTGFRDEASDEVEVIVRKGTFRVPTFRLVENVVAKLRNFRAQTQSIFEQPTYFIFLRGWNFSPIAYGAYPSGILPFLGFLPVDSTNYPTWDSVNQVISSYGDLSFGLIITPGLGDNLVAVAKNQNGTVITVSTRVQPGQGYFVGGSPTEQFHDVLVTYANGVLRLMIFGSDSGFIQEAGPAKFAITESKRLFLVNNEFAISGGIHDVFARDSLSKLVDIAFGTANLDSSLGTVLTYPAVPFTEVLTSGFFCWLGFSTADDALIPRLWFRQTPQDTVVQAPILSAAVAARSADVDVPVGERQLALLQKIADWADFAHPRSRKIIVHHRETKGSWSSDADDERINKQVPFWSFVRNVQVTINPESFKLRNASLARVGWTRWPTWFRLSNRKVLEFKSQYYPPAPPPGQKGETLWFDYTVRGATVKNVHRPAPVAGYIELVPTPLTDIQIFRIMTFLARHWLRETSGTDLPQPDPNRPAAPYSELTLWPTNAQVASGTKVADNAVLGGYAVDFSRSSTGTVPATLYWPEIQCAFSSHAVPVRRKVGVFVNWGTFTPGGTAQVTLQLYGPQLDNPSGGSLPVSTITRWVPMRTSGGYEFIYLGEFDLYPPNQIRLTVDPNGGIFPSGGSASGRVGELLIFDDVLDIYAPSGPFTSSKQLFVEYDTMSQFIAAPFSLLSFAKIESGFWRALTVFFNTTSNGIPIRTQALNDATLYGLIRLQFFETSAEGWGWPLRKS